jgi:hypothetical protein
VSLNEINKRMDYYMKQGFNKFICSSNYCFLLLFFQEINVIRELWNHSSSDSLRASNLIRLVIELQKNLCSEFRFGRNDITLD